MIEVSTTEVLKCMIYEALIRSFEIVPELVAAKGSETKDEIMHN